MLIAVRAIGLSQQKNGGDSAIAANMKGTTPVCMTGCFKFVLMPTMIGIVGVAYNAALFKRPISG
jgi:hypothetical protein